MECAGKRGNASGWYEASHLVLIPRSAIGAKMYVP